MNAFLLWARRSRYRLLLSIPALAMVVLAALLGTSATNSLAVTRGPTTRAAADLASLARAQRGNTRAHPPGAATKVTKKKTMAKKKPKPGAKTAKKTCQVKVSKNGKLVVVRHYVWAYRYIKVRGKRKRVMRRVLVPLTASCPPPPCVKQRLVKGKVVNMTHLVWIRPLLPRRGRLVRVLQRARRYVIVACPAPAPLGTPVTLTVNPGSTATMDFVAFQRQAPLSGFFKGYMVGGFKLGRPNQIILTGGSLSIGQTPIFIDDVCNGQVSAAIRTGSPSTITLDPTQQSTSNLAGDWTITSVMYTIIRLPLELRNGDSGCDQPYLSTGYDQEQATLFLTGKLTSLFTAQLHSAPENIQFGACVGLGPSTEPCNGFAIPIDTLVSTNLNLGVKLG